MGRQTRFYAHPDDYGKLATGLRSLGAIVLNDRHSAGAPEIKDIADTDSSINFYLTLEHFLAELRARYTLHPSWPYNVSDDPLVKLHAWRPQNGVLRSGRVYYDARKVVDLEFRDKPPEFVVFAERVRRWIRQWCQKREDLLLAPSLAARFDRAEIHRIGDQDELELLSYKTDGDG